MSLVACGADTGSNGAAPAAADEPALLTKMKAEGAILGMVDSPPTSFVESDGTPAGFSSLVTMEILKRMGVTEFGALVTDFPGAIPALMAQRSDIRIGGLTPNDERCPVMAFTKPSHVLTYAFAVKPGNPLDLHSLADLAATNSKLGTQGATTQERVAIEVMGGSENIVILPDRQSGIDALRTDRVDAFVAPLETLVQLQSTNPGAFDIADGIVPDLPILAQASVVRNEDKDFVEAYDKIFDELVAEGWLEELSDEYGFDFSLLSSPELTTCD
ncbi:MULTISPECIES: transporter substrate-binding domain-containing protein [unclassified Salinibacterium]|uniref:transporter substrate-binding domain-containing protein n=1 Tax=unclassified Salinibacterium TaxID=2632331 RepID=UPI00143D60CF|nr:MULTISPECIES: transporter substrate-binding domain-containing protein [unclassified Salinibacterium]